MKYSIFLILLLTISSSAVTLEEINTKPSSRQKNFLIWQFLHQDINATQASEAFYQVENVNERFLFDYAAKTNESEIKYTTECLQKKGNELLSIKEDDCLILALTPAKASVLKPDEREIIAQRLNNRFGNTEWLRALNQESFYTTTENLNNETTLFRLAGAQYRYDHFNHFLSAEVLLSLAQSNSFSQIVYLTVTDPKMEQLQLSLTGAPLHNYGAQTNFFLAMNAIKHGNMLNALEHLKIAKSNFYAPIDKDKTLFWLYQITKDGSYLNELSKSLDINMYVLYARELLNLPTENYFTTLPTSNNPQSITGIDPFEWKAFSDEIMASNPNTLVNLIKRCDGEESIGIQGYVLERTYEPYIHNFTMPYNQYMTTLNNDQKALVYALMRQETRLIPGLISRSFALGLMQIMPFNVDTISKVAPLKPTTYFDMLKPEYSIQYSILHLKHLSDKYYNPVLIAYGYNAGFGSTKRLLTDGSGRFMPGEYEPFLSMELMANDENREYGKKVLANYIIYKKILGEEVKITSIFDNLIQPSQSDYFRAEALKNPVVVSQSE
ncbi:MAG: transglycosylase SLT domain-containing protein [Sulfuricurvum sp.]|uniref:transglycosylase SLT domain-containing protein n=1 Tax=Sulfuricurvum sp. TaxID=2025608 RepID=UPI0026250B42|nr:transglycosylase SLT domain-containing protein [Sulfuricurvum sp.]MDD2829017.1 transglycosylase SLT domain-containing protein [Sulfuricurvum sp.]MDD4949664.1 transglycosylase SLT domain-containing protein [Sulfuricurvum sp.]